MQCLNFNSLKGVLVLISTLLFSFGSYPSDRVLCLDADGSFGIESAESPCCGTCGSTETHSHRSEGGERLPMAVTAESKCDTCVDIPLLSPSLPAISPSINHAVLVHVASPIFLSPAAALREAPSSFDNSWNSGAIRASVARIAQLGTVVIRC